MISAVGAHCEMTYKVLAFVLPQLEMEKAFLRLRQWSERMRKERKHHGSPGISGRFSERNRKLEAARKQWQIRRQQAA